MKKSIKTYATGTAISLACCFGLLNFLLGIFGLAAFIAYVNQFGDYIFFPAFAIFGTLLANSLIQWKKNWATYALSAVVLIFMIYFAIFGAIYTLLILTGVIVGSILIKYFKK